VARARRAGLVKSQIVLDPGIGFGKTYQQNYDLLAHLDKIAALGYPLLVGASRKAFIGKTLARGSEPLPPDQRVWGTAAAVAAAVLRGAHIVRVHDVAEMLHVARVADAIRQSR